MSRSKPDFEAIQLEIASMLDIPEEELNEEQRKALDLYLDELAIQEANRIDGFAQFVKVESARMKAYKKESKRLTAKAKACESKINFLKMRYLQIMEASGLKKIRGNVYSLNVHEDESVLAPSNPADLEKLDGAYVRKKEIIEPDKKAIGEALKKGVNVPGCNLVISHSLRIG